MADYKTHLQGGITAGVVIALGCAWFELIPLPRIPFVALAGIVGGIAPDIDSNASRPRRILFNYGNVIIPSIILWRIPALRSDPQIGVICWVVLALMRYPVEWLFAKHTVHRGMFHSTPAALIFGCLCFLLADWRTERLSHQVALGLSGGIGYFVHLSLDELWSVDFEGRKIRVKKSLGTALKLIGPVPLHNVATWGTLTLLLGLVWRGFNGVTVEMIFEQLSSVALGG